MIEIRSGTEVARHADEVFSYIADMSNNPTWQRGMRSCQWTSGAPLAVGSTYDQVATFLGKEIRTSFEVTEFEPGRRIRIVSTESTMPLDITRTVEPLGPDRCRVTAVVRGEPGGLMKLAGPVMRLLVKRSVDADYRRLRAELEG